MYNSEPSPEKRWRAIAEEVSKEQDSEKLLALVNKLIETYDQEERVPAIRSLTQLRRNSARK
jgi:hypothetical protein